MILLLRALLGQISQNIETTLAFWKAEQERAEKESETVVETAQPLPIVVLSAAGDQHPPAPPNTSGLMQT